MNVLPFSHLGLPAQSVLILPSGVALVPRIALAIRLAHDLSSGKKMEKKIRLWDERERKC